MAHELPDRLSELQSIQVTWHIVFRSCERADLICEELAEK